MPNNPDEPIRVVIFGAGNFANMQHLPNLSKINGVQVVAVCDTNSQAAIQTAGRFGIPGIYTEGLKMLESESLDALWSIVPAAARGEVESTAAEAGVHLFSEKPQATNMAIAQRIASAVREGGVLSTVCFRERYRPIFQEAKRLLSGKNIFHIRLSEVGLG